MKSVLVIEDSVHIRQLIREILEADGYRVIEAENGTEGVRMATTEAPDCIILDLIMPDMDGIKILTESLKGSKIPVVVVTAHIRNTVSEQCLEAGASAVVNKPFTKDELRFAVKEVLSQKVALSNADV